MGCLKLTYITNLDLVTNEFKKELTSNFSNLQVQGGQELSNHLGNVLAVINDVIYPLSNDNVNITSYETGLLQVSDYSPFGVQLDGRTISNGAYRYGFNGMEKDNEVKGVGNSYTTEFRQLDPRVGRWLSTDPLALEFPWQSPYVGFDNNPVYFVDNTGQASESTHTDEDGNVLAVYDDGDNGVYKHSNETTKADLDKIHNSMVLKIPTGAGGEKMGETEYLDEFVSPETGNTMTNYRIQFGKSFDPIISKNNKLAQKMNLKEIASESAPNGDFDIKVPYANVGGLLDGKYATSRSAGNYLAGYNAEGGTYYGVGISFTTFQKLAGGLHQKGSLTDKEKKGIVLFGVSYGPEPAYGEVMYQYRMSKAGWDASENKWW